MLKIFFLSCCCLKTVSPIHKILQELGFPTTKLSMSTGKELVTNNLSHNCEIAFSSFLQHYIFAYSWNWSSVPLHKKQTKNLFSNFFLIFRKEGWRFGEIYWFFFHLVWNVTFKFTPSKLQSFLLAPFPALYQKLGLCNWSVKLLLMELDEKQV